LDLFSDIFDLIDLRSFSNLWFWIALAVLWSSASHWVIGVPYDMVLRAQRHGGRHLRDLEDLARIKVDRMLFIGQTSGLWLLGLGCFLLTGMALLGFLYRFEFAQAVFLLAFPLALVALMSLSTAHLIREREMMGEDLCRRLSRLRLQVQLIGVLSIFFTALWGMYHNLTTSVLGG
jgi:hypothetical protein